MLTIRDAQLHTLAIASAESFRERMVRHISAEFPARYQEMGEAEARGFVEDGIRKGRAHQVLAQGAVAALIELMIDFGKDFERSPDRDWAQTMLNHPTLPDVVKMGAIRDRMAATTQGRRIVQHRRKEPDAG